MISTSQDIVRNNGGLIIIGAIVFAIFSAINWILSNIMYFILAGIILAGGMYLSRLFVAKYVKDKSIGTIVMIVAFIGSAYLAFQIPVSLYQSNAAEIKKQDPSYWVDKATNKNAPLNAIIVDAQKAIDLSMSKQNYNAATQAYRKIFEACIRAKDKVTLKIWIDKYTSFKQKTDRAYFASEDRYLAFYNAYATEDTADKAATAKIYRPLAFDPFSTMGGIHELISPELRKHAENFVIAHYPRPTIGYQVVDEAKRYQGRGGHYYRNKDYDRALRDYTVAIEMYPNSFDRFTAYRDRATTYGIMKQYNKGLADAEMAIQCLQQSYDAHTFFDAAQLYEIAGNKVKASEYYNKAFKTVGNYSSDVGIKTKARVEGDWNRLREWVQYAR